MVIAALIQKVDELTLENAELKTRLSKYETPKNSNNSSIPPSKDENRLQRRSLREQTGLKPGGQKGREGDKSKSPVCDFVNANRFNVDFMIGQMSNYFIQFVNFKSKVPQSCCFRPGWSFGWIWKRKQFDDIISF
jgi:hypothetical protein